MIKFNQLFFRVLNTNSSFPFSFLKVKYFLFSFFFLSPALQVDFLALEMRKGKVNFLWDVGSGVGRVEYPHHTIHNGNWHRIEVSRYDVLSSAFSSFPSRRQHFGTLVWRHELKFSNSLC